VETKLTVFTPTYNRAFCLGDLYQSLADQTARDFKWLIVDDGSSDNTQSLVEGWQNEGKVTIEYIYKANGGMHTAHNTAYANINTELNVCIDSDDTMPIDAVEKILETWKTRGNKTVAGIIGLDSFKDGKIIGSAIPESIETATLGELYTKYGVSGDKKLVLRTSVVKEFPAYPEFEGERLVPLSTLYKMIDTKYKFLCVNDVYCIVEYLPDGSSHNILKQYKQSPNGFLYARRVEMKLANDTKTKFTRAMHMVSSSIFAGRWDIFKDNPSKILTTLAVPFGLALNLYIRFKSR